MIRHIIIIFLFFALHLFWLLRLLWVYKKSWLIIPFWLLTVCWYSFITFVFCFLYQQLYQRYSSQLSMIALKTICLVSYVYVVTYWSLLPCGVGEGYPLFNPLVILAWCPPLLWCLKYIGFVGGVTCMILFSVFLYHRYVMYASICLLPFLAGFYYYQPKKMPVINACFIKPWWYGSKDPMYVGYRMVHDVTQVIHEQKNLKTVIMPESSFSWDLYSYHQFISCMCDYSDDVTILFGAQRQIDADIKNSYFAVRGGNIVFIYDKQHLVPFMERIPWLFDLVGLGELLCYKKDVFSYGNPEQNDVVTINGVSYQLFTCSELIFEAKAVKGLSILFVCNDAWFVSDYIRIWILLFIKYCELRYDVPILFGTVSGQHNVC